MGGSVGKPRVCAECGVDLSDAADRKGSQLTDMVLEGKYRLAEFIGEGAMGWVYRGVHLSLGSSVAVKLMKPSGDDDDINDRRFAQEARAASHLNSPHIISIMDFGRTPGGLLYIVSEYLRGVTLDELIEQGDDALPLQRILHITDQVLTGLEEAHSNGLIHRDLKPENVMVTPLRSGEDFVKLLDFGIAKVTDTSSNSRLTQQGQVIGTPTYMAPEQIRGQEVTPRTDLYALGGMIFEMLTGAPPFDSNAVMEVLGMHLSAAVPPIAEVAPERTVPPELEAAIQQALAKKPEDRFESAAVFRQRLNEISGSLAQTQEICPVCGRPSRESAKFCENCGARMRADTSHRIPVTDGDGRPSHRATADTVFQAKRPRADSRATDQTQRAPSHGDLPVRRRFSEVRSTLERRLHTEQTWELPLVGRAQQLVEFNRFLEGDDHVLEIVGPVGSGRTRLLHEAEGQGREHGFETVRMVPDPSLARRPWFPVQQVVGSLLGLGDAPTVVELEKAIARAGLAEEDRRGLVELFGLQDPADYIEHAVRLRETRAAALRALRERPSDRLPLLLLVDDADELDGASRSWIAEVAEQLSTARLKIMLASEESILPELAPRLRVEPTPLTAQEAVTLAEAFLDESMATDSGRTRALVDNAQGNVLHVTQALRLLLEGGTEVDAPLGDVIATRIGRLPTEALHLLQTLCVLGRSASLPELEAVLDHELAHYHAAIQLLTRRDLLVRQEPDRLVVAHPQIREVVCEAMPVHARRQLHLDLLEEASARGEGAISLARHAAEAGLGERALELLREAGHRAEIMLDDAGAAIHYRRALHVARWQLLLEERDETCLDLTLRLANSLRYADDLQGALMVLRESQGSTEADPAWNARLLHSLSLTLLAQQETTEALEVMQQAVRQAFFSGQPTLLNQIYMDLGRVLDVNGETERAAEELAEGVLMVTAGDGVLSAETPDTFWRLLAQLSELHYRHGNLDGALDTAKAALAQAQRHASRIGQARCHFLLGRCYDGRGEVGLAEEHHAQALDAFRRLGDRRSIAEVLLSSASHKPNVRDNLAAQARILLDQINWVGALQGPPGEA